jgi:6-phospho-3-hexuloisomerase
MAGDAMTSVANEVAESVAAIPPASVETLAAAIARAQRVVGYGLGREGLMLRALIMRAMHLGIDAHVAGDVTCPPVGPGDLLIVCDGPGFHHLTRTMLEVGHAHGAQTLVVTAQPEGPTSRLAREIVVIPTQTMADDHAATGVLPMGSRFEIAMLVLFDTVAVRVQELLGVDASAMRARHTNLE